MSTVQLRKLEKRYDTGPKIIKGVDLDVESGEFLVLVGPSGCGKSTILRMIAGLEDISGGELYINGVLANDIPPAERGVAMVFQSYALYPHMTVAENMGFALKLARRPKAEITAAVGKAAEILQISHLLDRKPKALSGGQRQRVAIGRAIVRQPKAFLFDEPLSNLDAALRVQMRIELSKLHQDLGTTMIYVTHDQVEAMTLGDRIVVLNDGVIEQVGRPLDLYQRPVNQFVAGFLGSPKMNFIACTSASGNNGELKLEVAGRAAVTLTTPLEKPAQKEMVLGVRPEHFDIAREGEGIAATVDLVEHLGDSLIVYADLKGLAQVITVKTGGMESTLHRGDNIVLKPHKGGCHLFAASGESLGVG